MKTFCHVKHNKMENVTETQRPQTVDLTQEFPPSKPPKKTAVQCKIDKLKEQEQKFKSERDLYKKKHNLYKQRQYVAIKKLELQQEQMEKAQKAYEAQCKLYNGYKKECNDLMLKGANANGHYFRNTTQMRIAQREIKYLEKMEDIKQQFAANEKSGKIEKKQLLKENKKNGVLKRVELLPDDMKRYIQSFFTYSTKFALLESKYNIQAIIRTIPVHNKGNTLLKLMCTSREYFSTLSAKEAEEQVFVPGVPFDPYYLWRTAPECRLKINAVLQKMKEECPVFGYTTEKLLVILFGKKKEAGVASTI